MSKLSERLSQLPIVLKYEFVRTGKFCDIYSVTIEYNDKTYTDLNYPTEVNKVPVLSNVMTSLLIGGGIGKMLQGYSQGNEVVVCFNQEIRDKLIAIFGSQLLNELSELGEKYERQSSSAST